MSGLGNVLGNVYGDANDRPKKNDLSDVQESLDALAEVAPETDDSAPADVGEALPALDALSDWVGFTDDSADDGESDVVDEAPFAEDNVFGDDGLAFLDDDISDDFDDTVATADVPTAADAVPEPTGIEPTGIEPAEADETSTNPENETRATWLDELDSESGDNWMDALADDANPESDDSAATPTGDDEPTFQDVNDFLVTDAGEGFEEADEQFLDDLFPTTTSTASQDSPAVDSDTPEHTLPEHTLPEHTTPESTSSDDALIRASLDESVVISPLASEIVNNAPSLQEIQEATAHGTAVAGDQVLVASTAPTDWIRSDDDILPTKGRGKRSKSDALGIAPAVMMTATADPISLFSPVDDDELSSGKGRSRKSSKPKRDRSSKKESQKASKLDEQITALHEGAAFLVEDHPLDNVASATADQQPASSEFPLDPPVIEDAGLPEAPGPIDPPTIAEDGLTNNEPPKPKRRMQLTRKKKSAT